MQLSQLFIIRIGLMAGVFLFAAITVYRRSTGDDSMPVDAGNLEVLRYLLWAAVAVTAVTMLILKPRVEAAEPKKKGQLIIIGWAVGEGAALLGTVIHFAGGPFASLAIGLLAFVYALILLPIPRARS